jgi:hypothetical protein
MGKEKPMNDELPNTDDTKPTDEGIEYAIGMFRTTLERGYKFVLCVETPPPTLTIQQSNMDDATAARMIRRFARRLEQRLKEE